MKKMFFTAVMVMGLGTSVAFAYRIYLSEAFQVDVVQRADEFKVIELRNLPKAIRNTLAKFYADLRVKAAAVSHDKENGSAIYKITFVDDAGIEFSELFHEDGGVLVTPDSCLDD